MNFKNTKPTAAEFFRKYSDLIAEAEKEEGDVADKNVERKEVVKKKEDKKTLKESNLYQEMMGESVVDEKKMGFAKVEKAVAKNPKVRDPGAVAASIGRKKYGKEKFQKMAAAGKKEEGCMEEGCMGESDQLDETTFEISYTLKNGEKKKKTMVGKDKSSVSKYFKFKYRHDVDDIKEKELPKVSENKQLDEKWGKEAELSPSKKGMFKGKTKADLEKQLSNLKKTGPHEKGSKEYTKEKELNFAIRAKSGWPKGKSQ